MFLLYHRGVTRGPVSAPFCALGARLIENLFDGRHVPLAAVVGSDQDIVVKAVGDLALIVEALGLGANLANSGSGGSQRVSFVFASSGIVHARIGKVKDFV